MKCSIQFVCLLLAFAAVVANADLASGQQLRVGDAYPDVRLPRIDTREEVAISDFRGKKILLVHFASW